MKRILMAALVALFALSMTMAQDQTAQKEKSTTTTSTTAKKAACCTDAKADAKASCCTDSKDCANMKDCPMMKKGASKTMGAHSGKAMSSKNVKSAIKTADAKTAETK